MKSEQKSKNKIKAILFDMDGVLINSENIHAVVESKTAQHFGVNLTQDDVLKKYSGVNLRTEFMDIFAKSNKKVSYQEMRDIRDPLLINQINEQGIEGTVGAKEILESLSKHYKLALASSGEKFWGEEILKILDFYKYFSSVIFGEDVSRLKPDPEPYLKSAAALEVTPQEAVVIEDSISGFKAAKAAGMILIALKSEHNQTTDFSLADFVIEDLREIPEIIERINHG